MPRKSTASNAAPTAGAASQQESNSSWRNVVPSVEKLEAWCCQHSIYHPHVTHGRVSAACGNGLIAASEIAAGEAFVSVPVAEILTERRARESAIGEAVRAANAAHSSGSPSAPPHRISPRTLLYLYLIHCRHSASSPFHEWFVHGVPRQYDTPLTWSKEELQWLQGTNLGEAVPHRLAQLRARFHNALTWLQRHDEKLFPREEFTLEAFIWAHDTYSSRGFPAQLADPSLAPRVAINPNAFARKEEEEDGLRIEGMDGAATSEAENGDSSSADDGKQHLGCLIPYIDLSNHRFMHPITWTYSAPPKSAASSDASAALHPHDAYLQSHSLPSSRGPRILFSSSQSTLPGREILNNYGAKSNEEFLMGYGFSRRENQQDQVTVVLGTRGLSEAKLALLHSHHIGFDHRLGGRSSSSSVPVVPEHLLRLMRISVMDEREVQQASGEWMGMVAPVMAPNAASTAGDGAVSSSTSADKSKSSKRKRSTKDAAESAAASSPALTVPTLNPSYISPRNELAMLRTLRTLFLGRLKRLVPKEMQEREVPQEVGLAQDASSVQQLSASYFSTHTAHETSLRSANELPSSSSPSSPSSSSSSSFSSSDISFQKYHFECAINYRLGQRKVLMQAVEEVEQRINAEGIKAQEKLSSSSPSTTAESAPASSKSDAPPRKSRKTGASTAASAASSSPSAYSSSPSISSSDVASWSAWFASQGGRINADFQIDGSWRVKDSTAAKETADGFTMLPLLYSFPLASCNPSRSPGFAPVWEFLQQRQAASEDGGEEEEPRPAEEIDWMRYALPLWLWQEILAPQSSTIAPWLRIVWPRAQHRQQQELVQQPFLTEEQQTVLDAVQSGDSKIALRFKSLDARHFSTVLRLVQEFSVELPRGGEEGENERVLVMVPSMPRRTPRKDGAHTSATILQDSAGVPRLILHSSSSLPGGSSVSLSSTFSIAPPLHRRATDVEDVAVRMSGIIGVYSALAEPAEDGDQDEDTMMRDAHNNAASIVPSFGIPLQPLGQAHIKLWRSLGLDAEADDEVYLDPSSMALPLLLAVVRSFFVPGKLLRGGTGAAEVRSRGSKPDALQVSGSKIDDSDEEDAATTSSAGASSSKHEHQADEPMEEDQEQEEEGDDDATMPTPAELDHASHAFARHLLQQEIDRRGSSEADLADIAILKNALERL